MTDEKQQMLVFTRVIEGADGKMYAPGDRIPATPRAILKFVRYTAAAYIEEPAPKPEPTPEPVVEPAKKRVTKRKRAGHEAEFAARRQNFQEKAQLPGEDDD